MKKPWIICWAIAVCLLIVSIWVWKYSLSLIILDTPINLKIGNLFAIFALMLFAIGLWLQGRHYKK